MTRKSVDKKKFITIFVITTLIFVAGILLGQELTDSKLNELDSLQQNLRTQTLSLEVQYDLLSQNPCEVADGNLLGSELYDIGERLTHMESSLGKNNQDVLDLKEYYSLLEIKHWLFLNKVNDECKENIPIILYFYSNLGDCEDCEEQGYVLTYVNSRYSGVNVFSFDINLDNTVINGMKDVYNLSGKDLPVVIINENVYNGLVDLETIKKEIE